MVQGGRNFNSPRSISGVNVMMCESENLFKALGRAATLRECAPGATCICALGEGCGPALWTRGAGAADNRWVMLTETRPSQAPPQHTGTAPRRCTCMCLGAPAGACVGSGRLCPERTHDAGMSPSKGRKAQAIKQATGRGRANSKTWRQACDLWRACEMRACGMHPCNTPGCCARSRHGSMCSAAELGALMSSSAGNTPLSTPLTLQLHGRDRGLRNAPQSSHVQKESSERCSMIGV